MKRTLTTALLAVTFVSCSIPAVCAQGIVEKGPWKSFRQKHPPLSYEEIPTPFVVREISGTISYSEGKPLQAAYFEIGLADGSTLGTDTGTDRRFELRSFRFAGPLVRSAAIPPGTYRFKVTKDGFHSAVGTIVVSPKAPKQSVVTIVLKPGNGYREEQPKEAPDEQLIPLNDAISVAGTPRHKEFPQKYSAVYMPVSLAVGRVRTPEFSVEKQWYDIMLQVEKPLPFRQMQCMMGVTAGPLEKKIAIAMIHCFGPTGQSGKMRTWFAGDPFLTDVLAYSRTRTSSNPSEVSPQKPVRSMSCKYTLPGTERP